MSEKSVIFGSWEIEGFRNYGVKYEENDNILYENTQKHLKII